MIRGTKSLLDSIQMNLLYFFLLYQMSNFILKGIYFCIFIIKKAAMKKLAQQLFTRFPLIRSHPISKRAPLSLKTVERHLGETIYLRFSNIYNNIVEALSNQDTQYLTASMSSQLAEKLIMQRRTMKKELYKVKISKQPLKNFKKNGGGILPERVWITPTNKLSISCFIYFGADEHLNRLKREFKETQRLFWIGKYRIAVYDKSLSFKQNLKNIYNKQVLEFRVQYESTNYLQIFDITNTNISTINQPPEEDDDDEEDEPISISSEFVFRTGSKSFDWMIVDINDLMMGDKDH